MPMYYFINSFNSTHLYVEQLYKMYFTRLTPDDDDDCDVVLNLPLLNTDYNFGLNFVEERV